MKILVTGGAGFIGSHLCKLLLSEGHDIRILDSFNPAVHGSRSDRLKAVLSKDMECVQGDVSDAAAVRIALIKCDAVIHLASRVSVVESMQQPAMYAQANCVGSSVLVETLTSTVHSINQVLLASSMSVYGEGAYRCNACDIDYAGAQPLHCRGNGSWNLCCPKCDSSLEAIPTPETHVCRPQSVYGSTKLFQEHLFLSSELTKRCCVTALRLFNVYGVGQAAHNWRTGAVTHMVSAALGRNTFIVSEDGHQIRDFVHVSDVCEAFSASLKRTRSGVFNFGTGVPVTILDMYQRVREIARSHSKDGPVVSYARRPGDVRHCYADVSLSRAVLGVTASPVSEAVISELVRSFGSPPKKLGNQLAFLPGRACLTLRTKYSSS